MKLAQARSWVIVWLCCLLLSCSARLKQSILSEQPALDKADHVLVLRQSDDFKNDGIKVGRISSGDNGLSVNCTYHEVIAILKDMARKNGANVLKITKRVPPGLQSSCEKIYADIYRVPDYRKHETEINWSADRRLTWDDFKGPPRADASKLLTAAQTACEISVESNVVTVFKKPKFFTTALFSCYSSWVKSTEKSARLLAHEQCHFDIAEVYRRKLQKELEARAVDAPNLQNTVKDISRRIMKAHHNEQAVYDDETRHGSDSTRQILWERKIAAVLH